MRRSTIVLLALFATLGLLFWYTQQPGNAVKQALATSTTTAQQSLSNLIGPDQGPVSQISVQRANSKTVTLKQAGGIWLVIADHEAPANQDSAVTTAMTAMSLRIITTLEKTDNLAGMGLDKPAYTVSLTLLDGSAYTFKIGAATVTDSGYYVQANDGSIVVIDKQAIETLTNLSTQPPFLETATPPPGLITVTPTTKP
jgi:hypothetical protein